MCNWTPSPSTHLFLSSKTIAIQLPVIYANSQYPMWRKTQDSQSICWHLLQGADPIIPLVPLAECLSK